MHDARETYRAYSGGAEPASAQPASAQPASAQPTEEAAPASRSLALAERGRKAARRLSLDRPKRTPPPVQQDDPDVVLDISKLHVDEIDLTIDELKARVALEAHVLDLLRLDVGVDAELRGVGLKIKGVDAQALLKVRLENLSTIVERVMDTIDRNPQILEGLTERLGATLENVGSGAGQALGDIGEGAAKAVEDVGTIAAALPSALAQPNDGKDQ
jgi:hypothetical protein